MFEDYFKKFDFKPLNDYVSKLEKEIVEDNNDFNDIKFDNGSFNVFKFKLKSNLNLQIEIIKLFEDTEIQFTFLKGEKYVETLYFSLYSYKLSSNKDKHLSEGINRAIHHEYYIQDGDDLTVYNSSFNYEDNNYISGQESIRKLSYQEFHKKLSDEILNSMLNPLSEIDHNKVQTIFKYDEDILEEPTINNFSIDGISYESNYLNRLNELINDNEGKQVSDEHYKSLKKTKSSKRKNLK